MWHYSFITDQSPAYPGTALIGVSPILQTASSSSPRTPTTPQQIQLTPSTENPQYPWTLAVSRAVIPSRPSAQQPQQQQSINTTSQQPTLTNCLPVQRLPLAYPVSSVENATISSTLDLQRRMLATMATLMMPAPAPTMAMNPATIPLTPAKHDTTTAKTAATHTTTNGQKQGRYSVTHSYLASFLMYRSMCSFKIICVCVVWIHLCIEVD